MPDTDASIRAMPHREMAKVSPTASCDDVHAATGCVPVPPWVQWYPVHVVGAGCMVVQGMGA